MTAPSLTLGCILLGFSPTASLLFMVVLRKPQLVILAVCSAFAYLLSALLSSTVWLVTSSIGAVGGGGGSTSGVGTAISIAVPGVACQMLLRILFVKTYFKVESVIRGSVERHEKETREAAAASSSGGGAGNPAAAGAEDAHAETDALQLQLNDTSCGLASGCGYALLHSLLLYGTLLASESGESSSYSDGAYGGGGGSTGHGGTLYQSSCGGVPSVVNGALVCCMFGILDVVWMMMCFWGVRRRTAAAVAARGRPGPGGGTAAQVCTALALGRVDDGPAGGSAALVVAAATHLAASLALVPNGYRDGCRISLPLLGLVVVWAAVLLRQMTAGRFLPEDQRRRIQGMRLGLRDVGVGQSHHVE